MRKRNDFHDPDMGGAIKAIFSALAIRRGFQARRPFGAVALCVVMLAVLASVLWYSYPREMKARKMIAAPIIRADEGPVKVMPDDPGGMEVPFRDSTIFETLRDARSGKATPVENLLADEEEPLPRDKLFAGFKTELTAREASPLITELAETETETENETAIIAAESLPPKTVPQDTGDIDRFPVAAHIPAPASKPAPYDHARHANGVEPAAGTPKDRTANEISLTGGNHYIQLGSLRSEEQARQAWDNIRNKFPQEMQGLELRVQKADLGDRGVFYRVQAGPVQKTRAYDLCTHIQSHSSGGCLVVSR